MQRKSTTKYSTEFKESLAALSQIGWSVNSVSKEYNVSLSKVAKWIRQANPIDKIFLL